MDVSDHLCACVCLRVCVCVCVWMCVRVSVRVYVRACEIRECVLVYGSVYV